MAATIQIHEMSALATGADKTSGTVRFKMADNATVDTNDPMVIPGAGSDYSFTKKLRAYMEAPPNTQISNLRWYSDGSKGWSAEILMSYKNLGVTWSLTDTEGSVVNSLKDVVVSPPAATVTIVLKGNDLQLNDQAKGKEARLLIISGTYDDAVLGDDCPLREEICFVVENRMEAV